MPPGVAPASQEEIVAFEPREEDELNEIIVAEFDVICEREYDWQSLGPDVNSTAPAA